MPSNSDNLNTMRHSAEHVLMQAMAELGYKFLMAMGPATKDGYYFDFELLDGSIGEDDLKKIENQMRKIIKKNLPITREVIGEKEARELFKDNPYKQEWIDEISKKGQKLTVYWTGVPHKNGSFVDLCLGPHLKSTGEIGAIKLLSIAGAYWRGSEKNKMLTRIYGTAFRTQKELKEFLDKKERAQKSDHRKLGRELDLFYFSDIIGPGLPLWTPKGTIIRDLIEKWAKEVEAKWGYVRVATPHIAKESLYETSGHLPYYKDDMYPPMEIEGDNYYLKGMNCPHHFEIYKRKQHSYRELPLRYAEYGTVYRYELSGSLFGLMRVRSLAQNDAHIFCTLEGAEDEFLNVLKMHEYYYKKLGLKKSDYYIALGLPDPKKKAKYHGKKETWQLAEKMMRNVCEKSGIHTTEDIGGAAFYGPKTDFIIKSSIGKEYAISTVQLDLFMPKRFNLEYVDENGKKRQVAVIHRAPLGSHERFIGFLIEHFAGSFPVWLSPVQVEIITISENHAEYAKIISKKLQNMGIRTEINDKDETMQNKIRRAQTQKVPYMLIIGDKEEGSKTISIRYRDGRTENLVNLDTFTKRVKSLILSRSLDV